MSSSRQEGVAPTDNLDTQGPIKLILVWPRGMDAKVHGCQGAWHGGMDAKVHGCQGAWHGGMDAKVHGCQGAWHGGMGHGCQGALMPRGIDAMGH